QGALQKMVAHAFPGNVRELENVVEQAAALSHSDEITADDVRLESLTDSGPPAVRTLAEQIDEAEREAIQRSMARADGNLERVARELDVSTTTLWRKMKRLGLRRD